MKPTFEIINDKIVLTANGQKYTESQQRIISFDRDTLGEAHVTGWLKEFSLEELEAALYVMVWGPTGHGQWVLVRFASEHYQKISDLKKHRDDLLAKKQEAEAHQIVIFLSSRGWGDYSPAQWIGDDRTPDEQILVESREMLATACDVDHPNLSDAEILKLIKETKDQRIINNRTRKNRQAELLQVTVPPAAIAAYLACNGNPENFEDGIDDNRYWVVNAWAEAIEAQGLAREATLHKISAEIKEMSREASYGLTGQEQ